MSPGGATTTPLPEGSRLVHIGPHKTGSTAIQVAFHEAREACAHHGVHYAGEGVRPRKAGWSIGLRGRPSGTQPPSEEHWQRLVAEVADAPGVRVCISNEDFGRADGPQRHRIVTELGGDRVHVVAAVRRLDRYLPSQWQERVKAGEDRPWEEWLRVVLDRDDEQYNWDRLNVWRAHDTGELIGNWLEEVPADRFHLLVADESDRRAMPDAFEDLLGLPRETLTLFADRSNRSLSWSEAELVRGVNAVLRGRGWTPVERRLLQRSSVVSALVSGAGQSEGPRVPPFPDWALSRVRDISAERVAAIRDAGVHVIGDPERMLVPEDVVPGDPDLLPTVSPTTAATAVLSVVDATDWRPGAPEPSPGAEPAGHGPDEPAAAPLGRRLVRKARSLGGRA